MRTWSKFKRRNGGGYQSPVPSRQEVSGTQAEAGGFPPCVTEGYPNGGNIGKPRARGEADGNEERVPTGKGCAPSHNG